MGTWPFFVRRLVYSLFVLLPSSSSSSSLFLRPRWSPAHFVVVVFFWLDGDDGDGDEEAAAFFSVLLDFIDTTVAKLFLSFLGFWRGGPTGWLVGQSPLARSLSYGSESVRDGVGWGGMGWGHINRVVNDGVEKRGQGVCDNRSALLVTTCELQASKQACVSGSCSLPASLTSSVFRFTCSLLSCLPRSSLPPTLSYDEHWS